MLAVLLFLLFSHVFSLKPGYSPNIPGFSLHTAFSVEKPGLSPVFS